MYQEVAEVETQREKLCFALNRASYLEFFIGVSLADEDDQLLKLKESEETALSCTALYGESLSIEDYEGKLTDDEANVFAQALYLRGTALAKISDIRGAGTAIKNWGTIKKTMTLVKRLGQEAVYYYGADRTLGIANTEIPSPFGSRKKAEKYLNAAVQNTLWPGRSISRHIYNSIGLARLYKKTKRKEEACSILLEILTLTDEEIKRDNFDLYYETLSDQLEAIRFYDKYKCN